MATKVAINGFGRIGMLASKAIAGRDNLELVAINATGTPDMIEYLLKYDSVHRRFPDVKLIDEKTIKIGKNTVKINSTRVPEECDFGGATVLIECTGKFLTTEKSSAFLRGNIKKVVMSAPAKDNTPTYVIGVNHKNYKGESIISNASCTTNCLAPLAKVLNDAFGIENGLMTTIHSYTNDQNVLDVKHPSDRRRARAAAVNMIPTTTGAAKAVGLVLPDLAGKFNGISIRVPTPDVSMVDLTANFKKSITKDSINETLRAAARGEFKDLIIIDEDKCVSSDFATCPASAIFVPDMTQVVGDKLAKVLAWYDNEWGYTNRLVDMAAFVGAN
ncbi:MAG: type I glyceraldehyde-3-phosphate dehydrogenase [Helicobacteraceae bacterium]|jgi:glyceraldehyde 3-phosphate dehydrogenase|nr:type I glyceraldehyde-3-phosphate dehydrogenase [Helicobacteraceae bacterium]